VIDKPDHEIIKEVRAGNISAYTVLLDRYKNLVFTLANNIIHNKEDAEEIAQDVFVKAFRALPSFKGESLFSTWLYRIVINTSLNKKKLSKIKLLADESELPENTYSNVDSLLKQQERKDIKKIVQDAIKLLKDDERLCIILFYINELSITEINELTGMSISNIKILLHRGRKNLYAQLNILLRTEIKNLI
jgi:RNA polymerase sigma factor (sigma-70 family)